MPIIRLDNKKKEVDVYYFFKYLDRQVCTNSVDWDQMLHSVESDQVYSVTHPAGFNPCHAE